jgi:hypothetical protein
LTRAQSGKFIQIEIVVVAAVDVVVVDIVVAAAVEVVVATEVAVGIPEDYNHPEDFSKVECCGKRVDVPVDHFRKITDLSSVFVH